jgi:iron transport multicopper oxidase
MLSLPSIILFCFGMVAHAATVTYDFNITWVTANPDGVFIRPVMGINGQWPIPYITATVGDRVVVNVLNQLRNASTSLHFHGLYMNGTTHMDGPVGVTQCSIPPGTTFTYNFTVNPFHAIISNTCEKTNNGTGRSTRHVLVPFS